MRCRPELSDLLASRARMRWLLLPLAMRFNAHGLDADDLVQEAWIGVWRARGSFRGGNAQGFVINVGRKRIIDAVRCSKQMVGPCFRNRQKAEAAGQRIPGSVSADTRPGATFNGEWYDGFGAEDRRLKAVEARDEVARALRGVPDRERRLAFAVYAEGETMREAGASVGISEARASQILARLRHRLRMEAARRVAS